MAAGQRIAFATIGAELYDPYSDEPDTKRRLRRSKIRGVESRGMVCSERELGLGPDHDGIIVLDTDAPLGTPIGDVIGETILDLELTPNRPDCLGMVGLARDVAALTGKTLRLPDANYPESDVQVTDRARVTIADPDLLSALCRRSHRRCHRRRVSNMAEGTLGIDRRATDQQRCGCH